MGVKPLNFFSRGCKFFFQGLPVPSVAFGMEVSLPKLESAADDFTELP